MLSRKSLLVVILTLALLLPAATQVWAITHLQVSPGNLVTLVFIGGDFFRIKSNGVADTKPFKPSSQTLMIMDIDWTFTGGTAGQTYPLALSIESPKETTQVFATQATPNADGSGGINVHLTSALTFGSGSLVLATLPGGVVTTALYLHGYVI